MSAMYILKDEAGTEDFLVENSYLLSMNYGTEAKPNNSIQILHSRFHESSIPIKFSARV